MHLYYIMTLLIKFSKKAVDILVALSILGVHINFYKKNDFTEKNDIADSVGESEWLGGRKISRDIIWEALFRFRSDGR